jgi:hypothetical protein
VAGETVVHVLEHARMAWSQDEMLHCIAGELYKGSTDPAALAQMCTPREELLGHQCASLVGALTHAAVMLVEVCWPLLGDGAA